MNPERPFVFASVGTDHHPFHRLVVWVDRWAARRGRAVDVLVQLGTAKPPRHVNWAPYLTHDDVTAALRKATTVVCHAGPGTVMSCRSIGLVPIVVPRIAGLGEHVDNHQVSFARRMAQRDQVRLAESPSQLAEFIDRAIDDPGAFRTAPSASDFAEAVARFGQLVERLVGNDRYGASSVPRDGGRPRADGRTR